MALHLITGGAGFIAVNLCRVLVEAGDEVLLVDDLSRGRRENLGDLARSPKVRLKVADCADESALLAALKGEPIAEVWHLAANSDIPAGTADLRVDLRNTFLTTASLLLAMKALDLKILHFASSSAIYGDHGDVAIGENTSPLEPISNYGAMKLASEAAISAACESHLDRADIYRFPNVVGVPATHGVLLDFVRKLKATPDRLEVLGDGSQQKPYLHVDNLVDAMRFIAAQAKDRYNVFNIGPSDGGISVREIAEIVQGAYAPGARIEYGSEPRGWVGDVPRFRYACDRLTALGWQGQETSEAAIRRAVDEIILQEGRI